MHTFKQLENSLKSALTNLTFLGDNFLSSNDTTVTLEPSSIKFLTKGIHQNKALLHKIAKQHKPDLLLTDWEPSVPRMASELSVPCLCLDSQHKFKFSNFERFPLHLKAYGFIAALVCKLTIPKVDRYILSTYQTDLIARQKGVTLAQHCLQKEIADMVSVDDGHLLVCVSHEDLARSILSCIEQQELKRRIICYGTMLEEEFPEVEFKPDDCVNFSKDLASCHAVFSTAQLKVVGEARYFGKPNFVVFVPRHYGQHINALCVDRLKLGVTVKNTQISLTKIGDFLRIFKEGIPVVENGVEKVVRTIQHYLQQDTT